MESKFYRTFATLPKMLFSKFILFKNNAKIHNKYGIDVTVSVLIKIYENS